MKVKVYAHEGKDKKLRVAEVDGAETFGEAIAMMKDTLGVPRALCVVPKDHAAMPAMEDQQVAA